jgi:hypothetical protein
MLFMQEGRERLLNINTANTRKKWILQLCDALDLFYPNEIAKIMQKLCNGLIILET